MTSVSETVSLGASADDVWSYIGDFGGVDSWHPAVATSQVRQDGGNTIRTLTLGDGSQIVERQDDPAGGAQSYTYTILESGPVPVRDYQSTLSVSGDGDSATVTWSSEFEADGAPEADAQAAVSGIYTAGFAALAERFGAA